MAFCASALAISTFELLLMPRELLLASSASLASRNRAYNLFVGLF
jgi:hypothetical protein